VSTYANLLFFVLFVLFFGVAGSIVHLIVRKILAHREPRKRQLLNSRSLQATIAGKDKVVLVGPWRLFASRYNTVYSEKDVMSMSEFIAKSGTPDALSAAPRASDEPGVLILNACPYETLPMRLSTAALQNLASALTKPATAIIIVTEVLPENWSVLQREHGAEKTQEYSGIESIARLLAPYQRMSLMDQNQENLQRRGDLKTCAQNEIKRFPELEKSLHRIVTDPTAWGHRPRELYAAIAEEVRDYFNHVWANSTRDEKLLLHQLASGHFVNYENTETIFGLELRGLLSYRPTLRISSPSFEVFVKSMQDVNFDNLEREAEADSAWSKLRLPLLAALVLILLFLSQSASDALESTVTLLSGMLAGVPIIIQLLRGFNSVNHGK
jgi:hypothetical protein